MKSFKLYLPLLFILSLLIFPACVKQNAGNGVANANLSNNNSATAKSTKAFPEVPANIMNSPMKGLDGKTFTLKDYEGKIILINLWATWCGPCRMEMPELVKLQDDYRDKGVMVIGLDVDPEPEEVVKKFVESRKLNYTIGWVSDEAEKAFIDISQMNGIPQSFLITPDGRLASVFKGYGQNVTAQRVKAAVEDVLSRTSE